MVHFKNIFEKLSLTTSNGLFIFNERVWEGMFSVKIEQSLDIIKPYAFFTFNNEPIILFFDSSKNTSETHTACWNFNVTPIIFFVSETDINIYNGFELKDASSKEPLLKQLAQKGEESNFTYWDILSGLTFERYQKEFEGKNRVDKKLLANIRVARNVLIQCDNKQKKGLKSAFANNLIGRLIFVRYLIDRQIRINFDQTDDGLLTKNRFLQIIKSKETLYKLFAYLQEKFKGELFPIDDEEFKDVESYHLEVLFRLFNGDEISTGQLSLFETYKFNIIPIEFISNIYEYFMGEGKQKDQKAYYTPTFLVNYVLKNTVSNYFTTNEKEISCKVLDPTCGSGIFLVESLRRIVGQYEKLNGKITNNTEALKKLVTENIFGIDKDEEAVKVAMFSLYITLLDYQHPKDIENFEFPSLLNKNFFVQDIFNYYDGTLFESIEEGNYIDKLFNTHFQFIIGNPPWGDVKGTPYMAYIKKREKIEKKEIKVSDKQFAQAFLVRTSDFCKKDTQCAVVIASKILYNNNADVFRKYFLEKFHLDKVLELSPVRKDVFVNNDGKKAVAPAAVLFYHCANEQNTDNNQVTHISIKHNIFYNLLKIFVIEKNDVKTLKQSNFKNYDWIWKVLLYGNALDFQFIRRLKGNKVDSETIQNYLLHSKNIVDGVGITVKGGDINNVDYLIGKPFLNTQKKHLSPFKINVPFNSLWKEKIVHRNKKESSLFTSPMLLIKKGVTKDFKVSACVSKQDFIFTDSIISIKLFGDTIEILYNLEGLFHSTIFTYFQLCTASSVGVERERILREELYSFPYLFNENVSQLAHKIESELKTIEDVVDFYKIIAGNNEAFIPYEKAEKIRSLYTQLNESIYDLYDVNEVEKSLIDYAENFSIPLFHNEERAFRRINEYTQNYLEIYANVFFEHFKKVFNGRNGQYFKIEARYNKYFICMAFKVLEYNPENKIEVLFDRDLWKSGFLANLSLEKQGDNLYLQKDIQHFEANEFLIIKPNEMKCWHKSLAYKDLFEIREKIVKANQQVTDLV